MGNLGAWELLALAMIAAIVVFPVVAAIDAGRARRWGWLAAIVVSALTPVGVIVAGAYLAFGRTPTAPAHR